jgi:serine/threonine protein kinase
MSDALTIPDGTVLAGRYAIVRCVGSGGMGAVYEAHDRVLDKRVAVKALHGERATDEKTAARFIREARSASAFRHENVAESFDFGTHDGRPFMVMELLDGEPLSAALARVRTVEPAAAVAIVAPIARALGRAHAADILHRDVKPENIFLAKTPDEPDTCVPKLVDFGISKRMRVDDLRLTASAVVVGTPAYMSPEQARAAPTLTPASDQYSLAVVLYELLSGALPHEGESYNELLVAKVSRPAASLAARAPWVSSALDAAVSRALSTDPAQRFASMEAFRKAIEGAIDGPLPKPAVPAVRNPHGEARALAPTEVGYAPTMDAIASVSPEQPLVSDETLLPRAVSTSAQPAVHPRSSARPAL